jgi:hypothetical protein
MTNDDDLDGLSDELKKRVEAMRAEAARLRQEAAAKFAHADRLEVETLEQMLKPRES